MLTSMDDLVKALASRPITPIYKAIATAKAYQVLSKVYGEQQVSQLLVVFQPVVMAKYQQKILSEL